MRSPSTEQITTRLRLSYASAVNTGRQHSAATHADPGQQRQEIPESEEDNYDISNDDRQSDNGKRGADSYPYGSPRKRIRRSQEQKKQRHRIAGKTNDLPSSTMTYQDNRAKFEEILEQKTMEIQRKQDRRTLARYAQPYRAQRAHWEEWCKRREYSDGDMMTGDKFFAFMKELVASDVHHNKNNPRLGVLPIRHHTSDYYDGCMPALHTITSYIEMIQYFYPKQCTDYGLMPNSKGTARSQESNALMNAFYEQTTKSQENCYLHAEDALYMLRKTTGLFRASNYWAHNGKYKFKRFATLRTRLHYSFDYFKADDLYPISDVLLSHIYTIATSGGEEGSMVVGIAIAKHSSVQNGIGEGLSIFERHPDVAVCPVGCLAFFLLELFAKVKDSPQGFLRDVLQPYFLLHAHEQGTSLKDAILQQNRRMLVVMVNRGDDTQFTTRGQTSNLSTTLIREHNELGGIAVNDRPDNNGTRIQHSRRVKPCYLNSDESLNAPTKYMETFGAYKLIASTIVNDNDNDGADGSGRRLREIHRATLIPPANLQRQLFPFLDEMLLSDSDDDSADWKQWILNLMTDRPEEEGRSRPLGSQPVYANKFSPAIQIALVLVYMRRVILQDMAVLMAFEDCPRGHDVDWQHSHFVEHPVFASKEFLDYARDLRAALLVAEASLVEKGETVGEKKKKEEEGCGVSKAASKSVENDQQEQEQYQQQHQQPQEQEQEQENGDVVGLTPLSAVAIYGGNPISDCECLNSPQEALPVSPRHSFQEPTPESSQEPRPELLRQHSPELLQEECSSKSLKVASPESLPECLEEGPPLQEPPREPLRAPLPEQSENELQHPTEHDLSQDPSENLPQDSSRQGSVDPSPTPPPQPENTSFNKLIARRQAIENIKVAMVYLDQQARSQTKAVIEFSATVVTTIESLESRMKILQDALQKLHVKKADSRTL
ncbi:MAG: hypothetical protein J3R72DRAFT_71681 [Linnemannia gamsii]|nr:MAG: hypothetical protein J3R72DRAFT_71681 [Linnemannia gamsii]